MNFLKQFKRNFRFGYLKKLLNRNLKGTLKPKLNTSLKNQDFKKGTLNSTLNNHFNINILKKEL